MADKKDNKKKDEKPKKHHSSGGMSFELEVVLFVVAIFVLWMLVGQPKTENADKPFIKSQQVQVK